MSTGSGISGGAACWSSGFRPSIYAGTRFLSRSQVSSGLMLAPVEVGMNRSSAQERMLMHAKAALTLRLACGAWPTATGDLRREGDRASPSGSGMKRRRDPRLEVTRAYPEMDSKLANKEKATGTRKEGNAKSATQATIKITIGGQPCRLRDLKTFRAPRP